MPRHSRPIGGDRHLLPDDRLGNLDAEVHGGATVRRDCVRKPACERALPRPGPAAKCDQPNGGQGLLNPSRTLKETICSAVLNRGSGSTAFAALRTRRPLAATSAIPEDARMNPDAIWPGFVGGIAVGLFGLLQLRLTGKALGCSTGFGNLCGLASRTPYFHTGPYANVLGWRLWFTLGLPLGGLLAVVLHGGTLGGGFSLGPLYDTVMPAALWARTLLLFVAGGLIGFGARMAGGCTSGHAIVGMAMLAPSSLLASVGFFLGGTLAVQALFRLFA